MDYGLTVTAPASERPVTIDEAKEHMYVDGDKDNALIERLIDTAVLSTENVANRIWVNKTLQMTLSGFPSGSFDLPRAPVSSNVNDTVITYKDTAGATQTLATSVYGVDATHLVPVVYRKANQVWPSTLAGEPAVVTVEFVAGYGATRQTVDPGAKLAILLAVATWYVNRELIVTGTIATELPVIARAAMDHLIIPRIAA